VLAKLHRDFPELVVRLSVARSPLLLERVRQGTLDLAVVASSGAPPEIVSEAVGPNTLRYYGRKDRFAALANVPLCAISNRFPSCRLSPRLGRQKSRPATASRTRSRRTWPR
jgi:DNA-binding transcriptional LysR family regulator